MRSIVDSKQLSKSSLLQVTSLSGSQIQERLLVRHQEQRKSLSQFHKAVSLKSSQGTSAAVKYFSASFQGSRKQLTNPCSHRHSHTLKRLQQNYQLISVNLLSTIYILSSKIQTPVALSPTSKNVTMTSKKTDVV